MRRITSTNRIRSDTPTETTPQSPGAGPQPGRPKAPGSVRFQPRGGSGGKRILVAIADNKIDFEAMGTDASKQLNELLHTPEVQQQFGIGPLAARFDPKVCERYVESMGRGLEGASRVFLKWPDEAASKLRYSESDKKEISVPLANFFDEFAPKWLRENQSFVALMAVFGTITTNKIQEAAVTAVILKKQAAGQIPGSPRELRISPQPPKATAVPVAVGE